MFQRGMWIVAALCVLVAGCGEDSPTDPPVEVVPVEFDPEIEDIFLVCTPCHDDVTNYGSMDLRPGVAYAEIVGIEANGYPGELRVMPREPDSSVLYLKISSDSRGNRMPPAGPLLPDEIELVRRWIAEGANP